MGTRQVKTTGTLSIITFMVISLSLPSFTQTPVITIRFANPQNDCATEEYCLDVEFQSSIPGEELFGMNVRFFYDEDVLELVDFRDFQGGYNSVDPDPPLISTSVPAGPALFNFSGAAEFINGAMQKTNLNAPPILLDTGSWQKIFQICFLVDDPEANFDTFCPAVVWDLEQDPLNGGFLAGDDGVVMSVLGDNNESLPADENVVQFNWEYIGNGDPPYGQPIDSICSNINCTMPLTLLSFTARKGETGNLLEWKTINEINVEKFEVQRRREDHSWLSLGFVQGAGTSQDLHHYEFTDHHPDWGTNLYRLRIMDYDGSIQYSPVVWINDPSTDHGLDFIIYPNPAREGQASIYFEETLPEGTVVRLLDATGRLIREKWADQASVPLDIGALNSGIYLIWVSNRDTNICKKILID